MKYNFTAAATSPSFAPSDPGSHWQGQAWHAYVNGTFGAAGALQIQYSPDSSNVSDGSSRWFAPSALLFNSGGDVWFEARFRKLRFVFTGGDGTTNVTVEVV